MKWFSKAKWLLVFFAPVLFVACSDSNSGTTSGGGTDTISGGASAALNAVSSVGGALSSTVSASSIFRANEDFAGCSAFSAGPPRYAPGPVDSNGAALTPADDDQFTLGVIACKLSGAEYSPEAVVGALSIARAIMACGAASIDVTDNTYQNVTIQSNANCFGSAEAGASFEAEMGASFDVRIRPTTLSGQAFNYTFELDMDNDDTADETFHVRLGSVFAMKNASGWEIVLDTVNGILRYDFNDQTNDRRLRMYVKGTMDSSGNVSAVEEAAALFFDGGSVNFGPTSAPGHSAETEELFTLKGDTTSGFATYHLPIVGGAEQAASTNCIDGTGCETSAIAAENDLKTDYNHLDGSADAGYTAYLADTTEILSYTLTDFPAVLNATNYPSRPVTAAP